jgi:hypothetical protein
MYWFQINWYFHKFLIFIYIYVGQFRMDKNINLMCCCHVWQFDYRRVPNWKQLKSLVYLFELMNTFSYTTGMHDLLNNIIVTTFGLQFIYFRDTPARLPISLQ